jgi:esterase/lipase
MDVFNNNHNTAYEFKNSASDKLAIYIDGTSYYSVLGYKNGSNWDYVSFGYFLVKLLRNEFVVLIPERLNMEIGKYYYLDPNIRRNYTLDNLVETYSSTINLYLKENKYSSIILVGASEGACLLPLIYQHIEMQNNVTGIVSIAYGGLSVYEQIKILAESKVNMPDYYRDACRSIEEYKHDVEAHPNSIGEIMGYTYRWWNSFKDYRPIDDYRKINIPVLFIHGMLDITVPVESTQYIQENLSNKSFEYLYLNNTEHNITRSKENKIIEKSILEWIKDH